MSTPMSTLSIQEAAAHYQVSTKTIRRWIKARRIESERVNGHWYVHSDLDKMSNVSTPNVHPVQPDVHPLDTGQIRQRQSEIDHPWSRNGLRDALQKRDTQIEQLNQLLAMQTQQNHQLIAQLPPLVSPFPRSIGIKKREQAERTPRSSLTSRIGKLFTKFRVNAEADC